MLPPCYSTVDTTEKCGAFPGQGHIANLATNCVAKEDGSPYGQMKSVGIATRVESSAIAIVELPPDSTISEDGSLQLTRLGQKPNALPIQPFQRTLNRRLLHVDIRESALPSQHFLLAAAGSV